VTLRCGGGSAKSVNAPGDALAALSNNEFGPVRCLGAMHRNTPPEITALLTKTKTNGSAEQQQICWNETPPTSFGYEADVDVAWVTVFVAGLAAGVGIDVNV